MIQVFEGDGQDPADSDAVVAAVHWAMMDCPDSVIERGARLANMLANAPKAATPAYCISMCQAVERLGMLEVLSHREAGVETEVGRRYRLVKQFIVIVHSVVSR